MSGRLVKIDSNGNLAASDVDADKTLEDTDVKGTTDEITVTISQTGTVVISLPDSINLDGATASRILATDTGKKTESVDLADWISGTADEITVTDDEAGGVVASLPDAIKLDGGTASTILSIDGDKKTASVPDGSSDEILTTDGSGTYSFKTATVDIPICLSTFDAVPSRATESNVHGSLLSLATAQPLDTVPTDITVSKGIGKIMVVINAGSDIAGAITVTGESIDRDTGASTPADTDTITIDALTTDSTTTDSNGNTVHAFSGAYITSKWFTGSVTLSTTDLTLTDVDVYHISFEQVNDQSNLTLDTFDANIYTTNIAAEFDAYLYAITVSGNKCTLTNEAALHVGADGETAIANKYWRLRRGAIAKSIDGESDGFWFDIHYSNSPVYVEDVTVKVWITKTQSLTLA
jgi:hypothetical protein